MKLFPAILLFALTLLPADAQPSFASGSNGSDGALNITGAQGQVITFDPKSFNPPLNPAGDNIFNFTTINITGGITLRLSGRNLTGPIYWLASGAVNIAANIDLSGESGSNGGLSAQSVLPAYPGAGGFAGGPGGTSGPPNIAAQPGGGPLGGAAGTASANGQSGGFTGNTFLIPLVGGSGGGGQYVNGGTYGAGGSAGGGALMIASSTSITLSGSINANGGNVQTCAAGGGAGGAIRLAAPVISGAASLTAVAQSCTGGSGRVRIETGNYQCSCFINAPYTITSTPNLYLPTVQPGSLHVTSIGGVTVPASPTGSFSVPDTVINTGSPVSVVVQASQIPPGTTVTLQFVSENTGSFTATTSALSGSLTSSSASASVTFPPGFTRGYATASW
jgi:hypothetical protein